MLGHQLYYYSQARDMLTKGMRCFSMGKNAMLALLLVVFLSAFTSVSAKEILFVSSYDPGSFDSGDLAIYEHLASYGYTITVRGSSTNPASTSDANGMDLVIISSTMYSGDVTTKFRDVVVPVLVLEPALFDDMDMVYSTTQYGTYGSQTQLEILMASHPFVEGYSGTQSILSSGSTMTWGTPNANADKIAKIPGTTDYSGLFSYSPGVWMEGRSAPDYRVGFCLFDGAAANLNSAGWEIFDNIIELTTGGYETTAYPIRTCDLINFGTSGRTFWIPLPGHDATQDEKTYTFISGGQLVEYSNGTARIQGTMENLADPTFKWEVDMRFTNKKTWAEWSALGRLGKNTSLGDETTWSLYEVDGASSVLTGLGGFAGDILYLSNNPTNYHYGLQIGQGANAMNSEYGLSVWFRTSGTYNAHGDINAELSCQDEEMPCASNVLAMWDLDACQSWSNSSDYSEFTATYPYTADCQTVTATNVFRNNSSGNYGHSCVPGFDGDPSMCVSGSSSSSFTDDSDRAVRFEVTLTPNGLAPASISGLCFYKKSPDYWIQYNSTGTGLNTGTNNPIQKFGVRVTVDGSEVYKATGEEVGKDWDLATFDFSNDPDFTVTTATTFAFELLGYDPVSSSSGMRAWDVDEIKVLGCSEAGALGDYVFYDDDADGTQGNGENGVNNVSLRLYECEGNGQPGTPGANDFVDQTTTNSDGYYLFSCLDPNKDYYVELDTATLPNGYELTLQDEGGNEALDSDGDAGGQTVCYDVPEGDTIPDVDFGIRVGCEIIDGGTVGAGESFCGPYDPANIGSVTLPEGGAGNFEYEWLYSLDPNLPFSMWIPEPNSNSPDFDPHFIDKTCWLVRCARRVGCTTEKAYSNITVVEVLEVPRVQFTVPTAVCNATSTTVSAEIVPGTSVSYNWTFQNGSPATATGETVSVSWANAGTYNITLSIDADGCVNDLTQPVMIDNCVVCDNVTKAGIITGGDVTCVVPYDPDPLTQVNPAQGGTGNFEYVWLTTTDLETPQNQWTAIPNSNAPDYDPGTITETTYFLRCVRRDGCTSFKESNVVSIEVVEGAHNLCKPTNFNMGTGDFAIELDLIDGTSTGKYAFSVDDRKFIVYTDGTALLQGTLIHTENGNQRWSADIWFTAYKDWGEWTAGSKDIWSGSFDMFQRGWDFYEIDASKSTLVGKNWFKGTTLTLSDAAANKGFQLGDGANTASNDYGAYTEFAYSGTYSGQGRIKLSMEDCQDVCTPDPKVAMTAFLQGAYDPTTGEMTTALVSNGLLPNNQPFSAAPWNYAGTETIPVAMDISDIVDWMLLRVMDSSTDQVVAEQAVLMSKDGSLRAPSNSSSLAELSGLDPNGSYYLTLCARNHLDVSTALSVQRQGRTLLYDFSQVGSAYTNPSLSNPPMSTMSDGTSVLTFGDVTGEGVVNGLDYFTVANLYFLIDYTIGDLDLSGVVNGTDLLIVVNSYFKFQHTR